jgi:hypothetical protein
MNLQPPPKQFSCRIYDGQSQQKNQLILTQSHIYCFQLFRRWLQIHMLIGNEIKTRGWTYIILIHRWTFNIFCLTTMQSLKCSKLTLIWKNENKLESLQERVFKKLEWLNSSQIKSYMAAFLTKPKTKSETSSSTLQVQFKEINHYAKLEVFKVNFNLKKWK